MKIGDKVQVRYWRDKKKSEIRTATVEHINKRWVALRFTQGYVECFWREKVKAVG